MRHGAQSVQVITAPAAATSTDIALPLILAFVGAGCGYTVFKESSHAGPSPKASIDRKSDEHKLEPSLVRMLHLAESADTSRSDRLALDYYLAKSGDQYGRIIVLLDLFGWSGLEEVKATLKSIDASIQTVGSYQSYIICWVYPYDLRRLAAVYWIDRISVPARGETN